MTGFFGDFDISGAADDPFGIPVGTYKGTLSEFDGNISGSKKDGSGDYNGMQFTITVTAGKEEGGTFDAYFPLPTENTPVRDAKFMRAAIKKFLKGLEVPEEEMNTVDPNDLLGTDVVFCITERKGKKSDRTFKNLDWIRLDDGTTNWNTDGDEPLMGSEGLAEFARATAPVEDDEFGLS